MIWPIVIPPLVKKSSMLAFDQPARTALLVPGFSRGGAERSAEQALAAARDSVEAQGRVDRMMGLDTVTYLPGYLLVKMDIATMAHSVEARSPFLDQELMEFAALAGDLLVDPASMTQAYLRRTTVESLIAEHQVGIADQSMRIWTLMMLEMWHREVLCSPT
jgi:asparagine synthase (glutamine-hydrolysing)